ncbi:hypothetical protein EDD85DRAFT_286422 [Armillaria nabsnona]|nr:hypothetical protein EDD85DRAFT_286422 [Armillaria nabsnona]
MRINQRPRILASFLQVVNYSFGKIVSGHKKASGVHGKYVDYALRKVFRFIQHSWHKRHFFQYFTAYLRFASAERRMFGMYGILDKFRTSSWKHEFSDRIRALSRRHLSVFPQVDPVNQFYFSTRRCPVCKGALVWPLLEACLVCTPKTRRVVA